MLQDLLSKPIITAADLRDANVHPRLIVEAIEAGTLCRAARGIYVQPHLYSDPALEEAIACLRTGGVIGLRSAAAKHGLCDASPDLTDMIVEHGTRRVLGLPVRLFRTRDPLALTIGVELTEFQGLPIRTTSPARTIVDLYRMDRDAFRQHAVAALATYLGDDGDRGELHKIARQFGAWEALQPEVEAAAEVLTRGFNP